MGKITENGGGVPTETCISQEQKVIKNRNWYQMIAITIFYNYTIRYINKLTLL